MDELRNVERSAKAVSGRRVVHERRSTFELGNPNGDGHQSPMKGIPLDACCPSSWSVRHASRRRGRAQIARGPFNHGNE